MFWKNEWKTLLWFVAVFLGCFYLPVGQDRFDRAVLESLHLVKWYAEEHVLLCLIPAFFIAGAISVFISQASLMKYLGPRADKLLAYGVASISGTILAVCSCTVLPLFAGIYRMGAGLGPATAFLYSGPAINVLAIILTARVLGLRLGIARALGAIAFSIVIGLIMHWIYRKEETDKANAQLASPEPAIERPLRQNAMYFAAIVGILVFANLGKPDYDNGLWHVIYSWKWVITSGFALAMAVMLVLWFGLSVGRILAVALPVLIAVWSIPQHPITAFTIGAIGLAGITSTDRGECGEWFAATWGFAKQILPLLLIGVLIAGALLGRPGREGMIPSAWVASAVGGNSIQANFFAAFAGAFMYFATLTEVPILQGLIGSGMGQGPALALLLAGPALSLPNMLVIRSIMGTPKTVVYVTLVVVMATLSGAIYGAMVAS